MKNITDIVFMGFIIKKENYCYTDFEDDRVIDTYEYNGHKYNCITDINDGRFIGLYKED